MIDAGDGLPLTVGALLAARVAEHGDRALLVVDDDMLTYAETDQRSAELARALLGAGLGRGSRIALLHPNGSDFVVGWLAAARIGAVTVPLSTFSTPTEVVGLLHGADVTALLTAGGYRNQDFVASLEGAISDVDLSAPGPLSSPAVPSLRRISFSGLATDADLTVMDPVVGERTVHPDWTVAGLVSLADGIGADVLAAAEADVSPADPMVIVHTSGSTSAPKGVVHTHGALIRHIDNLNEMRRYEPTEVLFANSPFFWIGGFAYSLLGTLVAGGRLVASNAAAASGVLDLIERERPTMVNGFAAGVAHLPKDPSFPRRDLSSICRGNLYPIMPAAVRPADPELRHAMLGMTEAGSVCLASDDESDQPEHRRGSFGRPVPGFEAEVRDAQGAPVPAGEVGVLWFRGPFLMQGYDGRERHKTFDPDGWYCTGDLVHVDDDGFVYFKGRDSDMIKTAGANVSPREVEAAILEVSGLTAHVVGVDDPERGQVVSALIRSVDAVDVDDLRARLRSRLSAYKVPKQVLVVPDPDVPMMSSGKLDLRALKAMFSEGAPR